MRELKVYVLDVKISSFILKCYKKLFGKYMETFINILSLLTNVLLYSLIFFHFLLTYNLSLLVLPTIIWFISEKLQKNVFKRTRPYKYFNLNIKTTTKMEHSFPSSHTAVSTLLFILTKNPFFLLIPLLRVVTFKHWLSDILFTILLFSPIYLLLYILNF